MEDEIMKRIEDIISEYAQLKNMENFDLSIELVNDLGDVNVTIKRGTVTFERTIGFNESLAFVTDTFGYSDTFTPSSKDIVTKDLLGAYFGDWGDLIVVHKDSTEVLRVKDAQREEISSILKAKLGRLFSKPVKKVAKAVKNAPKANQEILFQVYFTANGVTDYFIVAGDSIPQVQKTALDVLQHRVLDIKNNNVFSKRINN